MLSPVERAVQIVLGVHTGQKDKHGNAYIVHPLRVMAELYHNGCQDEELWCAALLHDTIEDAKDPDSIRYVIRAMFSERVYDLVDRLTRRSEESYTDFINRLAKNSPAARSIKLADLFDNLNRRGPCPEHLVERYGKAINILENWVD